MERNGLVYVPEGRGGDLVTDIYYKCRRPMLREAWRYSRQAEDVEELVQDAMVKALEKIDLLRTMSEEGRLFYMTTTVRNLAINRLARRKRFIFCSLEDAEYLLRTNMDHVEDKLDREMRLEQFRKAWNCIDEDARRLLERKYVLKHSDEAIAADLCIKPESVRMRLTRTKRMAIRVLAEHGVTVQYLFE